MIRRKILELLYRFRGSVTTDNLIKRGMEVGKDFRRMNDVWIDPGHCWLIHIGNNVTIAPRVTILAHDASLQKALKVTRIGRINIGDNCFIGAGSVILPGVNIGDNSIIGAGSVVASDIPSNVVAIGNPAIIIKNVDEFVETHRLQMRNEPCFGSAYLFPTINEEQKREMNTKLIKSKGYLI